MRISMRKQRRAAGRPGALPNLRRICGHKTGAPTPQKGVRCGRPTLTVPSSRTAHRTPADLRRPGCGEVRRPKRSLAWAGRASAFGRQFTQTFSLTHPPCNCACTHHVVYNVKCTSWKLLDLEASAKKRSGQLKLRITLMPPPFATHASSARLIRLWHRRGTHHLALSDSVSELVAVAALRVRTKVLKHDVHEFAAVLLTRVSSGVP